MKCLRLVKKIAAGWLAVGWLAVWWLRRLRRSSAVRFSRFEAPLLFQRRGLRCHPEAVLFHKAKCFFIPLIALGSLLLPACSTRQETTVGGELLRQSAAPTAVNLRQLIVPPARYGRHIEFPLHATYITIHSTDNPNATALQHARGMAVGAFRAKSKWNRTGFLTWHFTVDDAQAIQSLPLNIQGEHADHDGPGNTSSIGIEICEFRNPARQAAAIDRAARLTAWVMREKGISLDHVVPHQHWPQWHFHGYQKNCPRILLEHGKPGPKWEAFLRKIESYYTAF